MRRLLFAAVATAALVAAAPASAQVYFGVGPHGGGVEFGTGSREGWRDRDEWRDHDRGWRGHWRGPGAYAYSCPIVRERFVTPSGRVVIRTHRECD
jgi:hypothetical protein